MHYLHNNSAMLTPEFQHKAAVYSEAATGGGKRNPGTGVFL